MGINRFMNKVGRGFNTFGKRLGDKVLDGVRLGEKGFNSAVKFGDKAITKIDKALDNPFVDVARNIAEDALGISTVSNIIENGGKILSNARKAQNRAHSIQKEIERTKEIARGYGNMNNDALSGLAQKNYTNYKAALM